ncbi:MAG: DUF3052 domain-containing protein [Frankiales bacterium]|nr:DUF3052 domain-containing protein [Frankiales bacterium]
MSSAGYSGTPLARKLGIKRESRLLVVAAPPGFEIPDVPAGVTAHTRPGRTSYDVVVAFCPDRKRLTTRFAALVPRVTTAGALWVAWPKRASGMSTDLDENVVRDHGLGAGLVDVKVVAIDETWSGLKFVRRLRDR